MRFEVFGQDIQLVGVSLENGLTLPLTLAFSAIAFLLHRWHNERAPFRTRQGINPLTALLILLGVLAIWFDDPTRLANDARLVTADLAFALQRVIISLTGHVVILRNQTFSVADRITMGGGRDVIALGKPTAIT